MGLKELLFLSFFFCYFSHIGIAQDSGSCASSDLNNRLFINYLNFAELWDNSNNSYHSEMSELFKLSAPLYKSMPEQSIEIPMAFHIIHDNGPENLSNDIIYDALDYLNEVFGQLVIDDLINGIEFKLQFCLAQRSDENTLFNGINRVQSPLTEITYKNDEDIVALSSLSTYEPSNIINVRIVREIKPAFGIDPSAFAYYPPFHGSSFDGLVLEYNSLGSASRQTTSFIHEIGHYFGLKHTFTNGCVNDDCLLDGDQVCDTPPDQYTGPTCFSNYDSCNSDEDDTAINNPFRPVELGGIGNQPDANDNFMDYGNHSCRTKFTIGQMQRMWYFISNYRSSLLSSKSCYPPCLEIAEMEINFNIDSLNVGESYLINAELENIDSIVWYINGELINSSTSLTVSFEEEGLYEIEVVGYPIDSGCSPIYINEFVEVVCLLDSNYELEFNNGIIHGLHESEDEVNVSWTIVNEEQIPIFSSNDDSLTYQLNNWGYFKICLEIESQDCSKLYYEVFGYFQEGVENCENSMDDDNDGLIDEYDPDCPCNISGFQTQCHLECAYVPDTFPDFEMSLFWQSDPFPGLLNNFSVCDINKDGISEIVTCGYSGTFFNSTNFVYTLSGNDGRELNRIQYSNSGITRLFSDNAIFKFRDTIHIIFYNLEGANRWECYDEFGNLKWRSENSIGLHGHPNLADFNGDGIPEFYTEDNIVNATSGKLLLKGGLSIGGNAGSHTRILWGTTHSLSVAADFIPGNNTLELASGNVVYIPTLSSLSDSTGNEVNFIQAENPVLDGVTGMGDFNNDGLLEVVTVRTNSEGDGGVWIWDPRSGNIIASGIAGLGGGFPAVADIDNDCIPEIGVIFENQLNVYNYNGSGILDLELSIEIEEESSGMTSMTFFDFNLDGTMEIVYRDEIELMVLDGLSGTKLASHPIHSGTTSEYPIVADIDGDNQAEILVSGYYESEIDQHRIFCFEALNNNWPPARSIWNQTAYNPTLVNEDLSIPRYPQNSAAYFYTDTCAIITCAQPYNNFLTQSTYRDQFGCIQFPTFDLSLSFQNHYCENDTIYMSFILEYFEERIDSLDSINVNFYLDNENLNLGELIEFDVKSQEFPIQDTVKFSLVEIENINGVFGLVSSEFTSFIECSHENNIDSIELLLSDLSLDIGNDTTMCSSSILTIRAPAQFQEYLWGDGTTDSIYTATYFGAHTLIAKDECGRLYYDTILVSENRIFELNLLDTIESCYQEELSIDVGSEFHNLTWYNNHTNSCDDCSVIEERFDSSGYLHILARLGECIIADSVFIKIKQPVILDQEEQICFGETYSFYNQTLYSNGSYQHTIGNCDSIILLNLQISEEADTLLETRTICFGDSIFFAGDWVLSNGEYLQLIPNTYDCDSIINFLHLTVGSKPVEINLDTTLCYGDSIHFNEQWLQNSGKYIDTLTGVSDCDSIISKLDLSFYEEPLFLMRDTALCYGDSIYFNEQWINETGFYSNIVTNSSHCDSLIEGLSLHIVEPPTSRFEIVFHCPDEEIQESVQIDTLQNAMSCDSIYIRNEHSYYDPLIINDEIIEGSIGETVRIDLNFNKEIVFIEWYSENLDCNRCISPVLTIVGDEILTLYIQDKDGCDSLIDITVRVNESFNVDSTNIYIPNTFSPSSLNNKFFFVQSGIDTTYVYDIYIFDRWGNLLFNKTQVPINNNELGWDGTFQGNFVEEGVYVYKIIVHDGESENFHFGSLTLLK